MMLPHAAGACDSFGSAATDDNLANKQPNSGKSDAQSSVDRISIHHDEWPHIKKWNGCD